MRIENHHYTKFLISVQFDRDTLPVSIEAMMQSCEEFLEDLGNLALKSGRKLHVTYSVAGGSNGYHAHFGLSWLPIVRRRVKMATMAKQPIARHAVIQLLEGNGFFVDNPKQAIKKVTHSQKLVTSYILTQPKENQFLCDSGFYIHPTFDPVHSCDEMHSYCSTPSTNVLDKTIYESSKSRLKLLFVISTAWITLISFILLSIF